MAAVFRFAPSGIGLRTAIVPRWLALVGYALGLVLLLISTDFAGIALLFPLWVLLPRVYVLVVDFPERHGASLARRCARRIAVLRWIAVLILLAALLAVDRGTARAAPGGQSAFCSSNTIGQLTFVNCYGSGTLPSNYSDVWGGSTYSGTAWGGFVGVTSPSGYAGGYASGSSSYFSPRTSLPLTSWTCFPYPYYSYYYLPC